MTRTEGTLPDDLLAPEVNEDPHPYLAALREHDPVHSSERHKAWTVTRYDDCTAALTNFRQLSSDRVRPLHDDEFAARAPARASGRGHDLGSPEGRSEARPALGPEDQVHVRAHALRRPRDDHRHDRVRDGHPVRAPTSARAAALRPRRPRRGHGRGGAALRGRDNPHIAFGKGIHACIGAQLARLALASLVKRLPGLRFADGDPELHRVPSLAARSLSELRVAHDATA